MRDQSLPQRSATDERIAENQQPAPIAPATRDAKQTEPGGLPPGHSDGRSPLDPLVYDPMARGNAT